MQAGAWAGGRTSSRASYGCRVAAALLLAWTLPSGAMDSNEARQLLERADQFRMGQPTQFAALLYQVAAQASALPAHERDYLRYLRAYQASYLGNFDAAIPMLEALTRESTDPTLQFRAATTIANVYVLSTRYELA